VNADVSAWKNAALKLTADFEATMTALQADGDLTPKAKAERTMRATEAYQSAIRKEQEEATGILQYRAKVLDEQARGVASEDVKAARASLGADSLAWYGARLRRTDSADILKRYQALGDDDAWERAALEALAGVVLRERDDALSLAYAADLDKLIVAHSALGQIKAVQAEIESALQDATRWDVVDYERDIRQRFRIG